MLNSPVLHAAWPLVRSRVCALLVQQATFLIFFAVACVLYVGGGAGYAVKVQGKTFAQDGQSQRRLLTAFRSWERERAWLDLARGRETGGDPAARS